MNIINNKVRRFGSLDRLSAFSFEGKIKFVVNEKAGTRNFGEQIASRLIHSQTTKDLAREALNNTDGDYSFLVKSLLNSPSSYQDGNYSRLKIELNYHELNLLQKFLNLKENICSNDVNTYGRIRLNNKLYCGEAYEKKHKRQSSVSKWVFRNNEFYGIIQKFVQYKDKNLFLAKKFTGKIKFVDFYTFSRTYKQIFEENNFDKYFPIFNKCEDDESNMIVCLNDSLISTCVMTNLADSNKIMVTQLIGFEHD